MGLKWLASKTTPDMSFPIHPDEMADIMLIQKILIIRGFLISERSVEQAWSDYSESKNAGWIGFDDPLWAADQIMPFLKEVD